MESMLYRYDQLHRIVQARSLTDYGAGTGFASRNTDPAPYDVDYSYDANGNLLTLLRRDHLADTLHDYNYLYYANTNRLRQVTPPKDMVYDGGAIVSNTELYRKITVQGDAYIPQGQAVELRALEEIELDPDFEAPDGMDFWAHIVADSGMYQYDAIGNLVLDQHEGVKIRWTPYGKVREVRANRDSLITTFRYDGTGNRIEKKVTRKDTVDIVSVTRYVRDASGNVMAVYKDTLASEFHIYGSSRLGLYRGGRYNGQRSLGGKDYELSNHLGNVLAVVTDNIGMDGSDSVWASVVSTSDYYPFGLEMAGRAWRDTASVYRYGFNGKEKGSNGEWGNTAYDYGFRIYDPSIARFLSIDPITRQYPELTPYQFASNTPIQAIDLDGLEALIVVYPDFKVDPEIKIDVSVWGRNIKYRMPKQPLGHAGVLLIEDNGTTRYFEYGRYSTTDGTKGRVRRIKLDNNVKFGEDGLPTNESLNKVLGELSQKSGQKGRVQAAYIETNEVDKMLKYAWDKLKESNPEYPEYNKDREPYNVTRNNCGTFAADCIGEDITIDRPTIINPTPSNIVEEYIEEGNREISYDPKVNRTTVGQGDERDAKNIKD